MNKILIIVCTVAILLVAYLAIPVKTDVGERVVIRSDGAGNLAGIINHEQSTTNLLKALVKGSIYETGEFMTVFGTCLNASDGGYVGSYATFSSWYPNGTQFFADVNMSEIQTGYFFYNGYMSSVGGTYLTEMTCHIQNSSEVAKATGEWQNPVWVGRIANISDQISNLSQNLSITIGDLMVNISDSFEITWENQNYTNTLINQSFVNLTEQITYVAQVANGSVDRNDSYLAWLMQQVAAATGTPITHNLTITEYPGVPIYWKDWKFEVAVQNEYNVSVGYPLVSCWVSTNNYPPSVNVLMSPLGEETGDPRFTHSEKVKITGDFNWTVNCAYN